MKLGESPLSGLLVPKDVNIISKYKHASYYVKQFGTRRW